MCSACWQWQECAWENLSFGNLKKEEKDIRECTLTGEILHFAPGCLHSALARTYSSLDLGNLPMFTTFSLEFQAPDEPQSLWRRPMYKNSELSKFLFYHNHMILQENTTWFRFAPVLRFLRIALSKKSYANILNDGPIFQLSCQLRFT